MEQIARKGDLTPKLQYRYSTIIPDIGEDLHLRIKALFQSRNERRPPRVPCSSPDHRYLRRPTSTGAILSQTTGRSYTLSDLDQSVAKDNEHSFIPLITRAVTTMYDGTPGQLTADSRGQMRSSVEQPAPREIPKGMDNTLTSGVDSGLVQHISNASKQDTPIGSSKTRANSIPTRSSSDGRTLRYSLRVVPPKRTSTFDFQNGYSTQDTSGAKGTGMVTDQPMSDEHFQSIEQGIQVQDHQQQPATIESIVAMIEASKNAKDAPLDIENQAEEEQHPNFVRQEANVESQSLGIDAPIHDSHQDQTPLGEERETEPSSLSEPHAPVPDMKPSKNDVAQSSKAGGAISNHSTLSSMSQSRASPVLSVRRRRQGSSIQPSEIQWSSKAPSSVNIAENHENEGAPHLTPGLTGKRAVTTGPNSNLTARSGHYRHEAAKGRKIRAETMPSSGMAFGKPNRSGADSPEEASLKQQNAHADQAFSKVITDLEALLQEAINLAGEAANSGGKQDSFENRASGTKRSTNKMVGAAEESDSISSTFDTGQGHFTRRPLEPKGQVRLQEPTKDAAKASPKKHRDATPLLAQSIVPPEVEVDVPGKPSKTHTGELGSKPMEQRAVEREAKDLSPPSVKTNDWAYVRKPSDPVPTPPLQPPSARKTLRDDQYLLARNEGLRGQQRGPVIQTRSSSVRLDGMHFPEKDEMNLPDYDSLSSDSEESAYLADFKESAKQYHPVYQNLSPGDERRNTVIQKDRNDLPRERDDRIEDKEILYHSTAPKSDSPHRDAILKDRHHFSIREPRGFSLSRSHRRKPIARDWSNGRKRFVATVTCITTALLGLVLGIYAGEVPAIQYTLADEHHYTILGNVVLFLGLAASTILFWPLPVLHGRKPYTTAALVILLPLQFPQALAVNSPRSPYVATYRTGILLPRAISGFAMGLANINFMTTLLDLFGASLQSRNPHQEVVNQNDVRRHGGGIGAWLGIWTWCSIMSLGVGFLIGGGIISRDGSSDNERSSVPWGFWITIILNAFVLFLNVIVPEVRRSQYRRSMAEVRTGTDISRRVARGEIKMHLDYTGPKNWFEEVEAGYRLCLGMLKQPGFLVLALYQGWIYGQIVLVIAVRCLLRNKCHFIPY